MVRGPDRRPAESLGEGCCGVDAFGRRAVGEVREAQSVVHRAPSCTVRPVRCARLRRWAREVLQRETSWPLRGSPGSAGESALGRRSQRPCAGPRPQRGRRHGRAAVGCTLVLTDRQLLLVRDGHSFRPRSGIQRWVVDRSLSVRLGPVRQTTGQLAIECRGRTSSVFLTHAEIPAVDALVAEIRRRIYRAGLSPPALSGRHWPRGPHPIARGHAPSAQPSNSRSVRTTSARSASGSTHRNVPDPPKWPNVAGLFRVARPVRGLARRAARTRGPSRADRTRPPRAARPSARERRRSWPPRTAARVTSVGRRSSAASRTRSSSGPWRPCDGRSRRRRRTHSERGQDRRVQDRPRTARLPARPTAPRARSNAGFE